MVSSKTASACWRVYFNSVFLICFISEVYCRLHWPWNSNHTLYMEDICKDSKRPLLRLSNTGSMSYGYLTVSKSEQSPFHSVNCSVKLKASQGHGVTVAFRTIATDTNCASYVQVLNGETDEILSNSICGSEFDKMEQNYVYSTTLDSTSLRIFLYVMEGMAYDNPTFLLTFTSFANGVFEPCDSQTLFLCHNRKCIFKPLLCDGHNNCGDLSDELDNGVCNVVPTVPSFGTGSYVGIVVALLILILIFLFIVVPHSPGHRLEWLRSFRRRRRSGRTNSAGCHHYRPRSRSLPRHRSSETLGVATVSLSVPIRYLPNNVSVTDIPRREPPPNYNNQAFENIESPPPYEEAIRNSQPTRRSRSH